VRRLAGPTPAPPPASEPPAFDDDELLAMAPVDGSPLDARVLVARLTDGSCFVEMVTEHHRTDAVTGWAEVCGFPVGIVVGPPEGPFAEHCDDRGVPVITVRGPFPVLSVRRAGETRLTFAWPRPDGAPDGVDAVIDPRDTRVALGISLAATRPR
jgi:acetyl-CoA carboxylase carboxyltransferase component